MKNLYFSLGSVLVVLVAVSAWGDTLYLKNGTRIDGKLKSATSNSVVIRDNSGVDRTFDVSQLQRLEFSEDANAAYSSGGSTGASAGSSQNTSETSSTSSSSQSGGNLIVPTGSEISVRTNDSIDSASAQPGQTFSAQIANDVMGGAGEVLVPKGADAQLVLRQVSSGGTTGSSDLTLDLQSITTGGHTYQVSSEDVQQSSNRGLGKNKRTATMVGGGAVLGTLLGAIAGGGKGAAIGAISGAAAGGTAQVLTRGHEVKVPAETVLTFKLDEPLHLQLAR